MLDKITVPEAARRSPRNTMMYQPTVDTAMNMENAFLGFKNISGEQKDENDDKD